MAKIQIAGGTSSIPMADLERGQYASFRGEIGVRTMAAFITLDGLNTYTAEALKYNIVQPLTPGTKIQIEVEE